MVSYLKKCRRESASNQLDVKLNHLLVAVPLPRENIEVRAYEGELQLRREIEPNSKILSWCIDRFHFDKDLCLKLDRYGSSFWELMDGHRTLGQIGKRMSEQFEMEPKECEKAVILYTKMLMRRHFIDLWVPTPEYPSETEPSHA